MVEKAVPRVSEIVSKVNRQCCQPSQKWDNHEKVSEKSKTVWTKDEDAGSDADRRNRLPFRNCRSIGEILPRTGDSLRSALEELAN